MTAGAFVAGFLGTQAVQDSNPGWWGHYGTAAFVVLVGAVLYVLWPRSVTLIQSPRAIIAAHIDTDESTTIDQMRWILAEQLEESFDVNETVRGRMSLAIMVGCGALGFEVLAWLLELGG